jgi:A/G-specific adenine glycosylase
MQWLTPERSMSAGERTFARRLLAWHATHGRHDLPWVRRRSAYTVWLSEIMLQQTQVRTVIPYFERFIATFPDVAALAAARPDEVLHLWTGLGYYSRARNLHAAVRVVVERHGGELPRDLEALMALPGIGRSTAGAILAQAHGLAHPILDGNVKRVLTRYHAVPGWPGEPAVATRLWALAAAHLPTRRVRDYTQALMDLGATVCTRARPRCTACPLAMACAARARDCVADFPAPRPRRAVPERSTCFLVIENGTGAVLLERRPPRGIWGGLWCFPEIASAADAGTRLARLGLRAVTAVRPLPSFVHGFTHFRLAVAPLHVRARAVPGEVRERDDLRWHSPADSTRIGLSAPVVRLLRTLASEHA